MSDLVRLLDPAHIAIAGLSENPDKHGARVLRNLRRIGFEGAVWGVNPTLPRLDGVDVYPTVAELPEPPDVVVAAVPARAAVEVVSGSAGVGAVVVFAAGFAEAGAEGAALQEDLARAAEKAGTRVVGPNSGGVIRPGRRVAASFLTCLDRPARQIRSGAVALVTQSGGTGSYIHNLAASRGEGIAVSIATGNEADVRLGEALEAVVALDEVEAVIVIVETLRDGTAFRAAVHAAHRRGKRIVACHIGAGRRGRSLMRTHTGALAVDSALLGGLLTSLGVVTVETPAEAYEVANLLAHLEPASGERVGIITHSGGAAILLADLAEKEGVVLPRPSPRLSGRVEPLLDHGSADNPLDMGAIIGGPARFAEVVDMYSASGEYDALLAVSTPHPPAHTDQRVEGLLGLRPDPPIIQLWMAGDQAAAGLSRLRAAAAAVTEEPRAAIRALAGSVARGVAPEETAVADPVAELPLDHGLTASDPEAAVAAAERLGYPVVLKGEGEGMAHKTELGAVRLDLRSEAEVETGFAEVGAALARAGWQDCQVRLQRYRPGLEMMVGGLRDPGLGPMVSVGLGGILTEAVADVVFAAAPVDERAARRLIDRLSGRQVLDGFRHFPPADVDALAGVVVLVSQAVASGSWRELEINPLIWDGREWRGVDWLLVP